MLSMKAVTVVAATMFMVLATRATPTTPLSLNTSTLATWYCSRPSPTSKLIVTTTPDFTPIATAQFNRSVNDIGWDFLRVKIEFDSLNISDGWYGAGFIEGFLTADRINSAWVPGTSAKAGAWIDMHIRYMEGQVAQQSSYDEMWRTVGYIFAQLRGLADGYNAARPVPNRNFTFHDMFMINFAAEVGDVEEAVSLSSEEKTTLDDLEPSASAAFASLRRQQSNRKKQASDNSHCSALVKWTNEDLFVAHDTWSGYSSMTYRMFKVYDFCPTVTFSAHPAFVSSMDDWYQTSNQLAIQETTNGVFNNALYENVVPQTVSEFLRVMAATYLSNDAESWTTYFARHNSGTYNNQYMVVDFKLYAPGASPPDEGLLWIAEQIPGFVYRSDESKHLKYNGYWASYNIPYSPFIFNASGFAAMEAEQGSFWSYRKYARAEIFARNQVAVSTIEDVQNLMRFNNYTTDPFSLIPNCTGAGTGNSTNKCSPAHSSMLSVASRGDLMTVYPTAAQMLEHYGPLYEYVAQGCFGAIDAKIASYTNRHTLTARIISGPTSGNGLPPFSWGTNGCPPAPAGPTKVDFPWVEFMLGTPSPP